eukprot:767988-Hanusia_phi.AAC.2
MDNQVSRLLPRLPSQAVQVELNVSLDWYEEIPILDLEDRRQHVYTRCPWRVVQDSESDLVGLRLDRAGEVQEVEGDEVVVAGSRHGSVCLSAQGHGRAMPHFLPQRVLPSDTEDVCRLEL